MVGLKLNKYESPPLPLEVAGRGSETQLQVGGIIIYPFNPLTAGAAYFRVLIFY